ncbi:MAG: hypothetical protein NC102_01890 [Clostridium sp.]|nr:hypothetical protein [Clostridium sp.]
MNRTFAIIALIVCACASAMAQPPRQNSMTEEERDLWLAELRQYKHEFIAKELSLSTDQQEAFFPLYDEMDDQLTDIAQEVRDLEMSINSSPTASAEEVQAAAFALFDQKRRESVVELLYFEKFKDTLTPKQLFRLKNAERKFTQQLVKHHRRK